ncbi:MAG: YdeI/OmpD-associated family protein [Bacteroidota bacterium]
MVQYTTIILKFEKQGEKTGWTYMEVPADIAQQLKPNHKKSFRVKGKLDNYSIAAVALLPMGGGNFIMPLNGAMRKAIGKRHGAQLKVQLEPDDKPLKLSEDFMTCLKDEPKALVFFNKIPKSVQNYFSKWIESAKTELTKAKRIAKAVNALAKSQSFSEMIREFQKKDVS